MNIRRSTVLLGLVVIVLLVAFAGSCFSAGTFQENVCHIRVYFSSTADAPIYDILAIIIFAFLIVHSAGLMDDDFSDHVTDAFLGQTVRREERNSFIKKLYNPLLQSLRSGILHPRLDGASA